MGNTTQLQWFDYIVFITMILKTLAIEVYCAITGKGQHTISDYFAWNRKLSVLLTIISVIVSNRSSVCVIGVPAEAYHYGYYMTTLGFIGTLLAAVTVLPVIWGGIAKSRGFDKACALAKEGGRLDIFDLRFDPTVRFLFWALLIGLTIDFFFNRAFYQPSCKDTQTWKHCQKLN